jgi:hypothetical protein
MCNRPGSGGARCAPNASDAGAPALVAEELRGLAAPGKCRAQPAGPATQSDHKITSWRALRVDLLDAQSMIMHLSAASNSSGDPQDQRFRTRRASPARPAASRQNSCAISMPARSPHLRGPRAMAKCCATRPNGERCARWNERCFVTESLRVGHHERGEVTRGVRARSSKIDPRDGTQL